VSSPGFLQATIIFIFAIFFPFLFINLAHQI